MKPVIEKSLNIIQLLKLDNIIIKLSKIKIVNKNILKYCWDNKSYEYYNGRYIIIKKFLDENNISLKNKKVLEIGSGNSIGVGYFFLNEDYDEWIGSDLYRNPNSNYQLECDIIQNIFKKNPELHNYIEIKNNEIIYRNKLGFINLDISKYEPQFENHFDIIISSAVLEHVPKELINQSIKNMSLYLKKGGFMLHEIDLRDHINLSNPFNFYKYNDHDWNKLTKNTIFYTNRLRCNDFIDELKRNNFSNINIKLIRDRLIRNIHMEIRDKYKDEDLEVKNLVVIAKKF